MQHHPIASWFPMLSDDELQELADDIRANGLRHPIVIDQDDLILDGRNRSAACIIAGVEPVHEVFTGSDADKLRFVVSSNIHRRHLDTSQRAMLGARLEDEFAKLAKQRQKAAGKTNGRGKEKVKANSPDPKSQARDDAAKVVNVGGRSVSDAKTVLTKGTPEQVKAVESGKAKVSSVAKEIRGKAPAKKQTQTKRGKKQLTVTQLKAALKALQADWKQQEKLTDIIVAVFRDMPPVKQIDLLIELRNWCPWVVTVAVDGEEIQEGRCDD